MPLFGFVNLLLHFKSQKNQIDLFEAFVFCQIIAYLDNI